MNETKNEFGDRTLLSGKLRDVIEAMPVIEQRLTRGLQRTASPSLKLGSVIRSTTASEDRR
jgi:hypothetical protein